MIKKNFLKELEYSSKKVFGGFFKPSFDPIIITSPILIPEFSTLKRILVLRHDRIGDSLVSSPFVRALRNVYPNSEIDILLSPKNSAAKAAFIPFADKFFVYEKKLSKALEIIKNLRNRNYDLLIDPFDKESTTNSALIKFIKPKYALGIYKENFQSYTHVVKIPNIGKINVIKRIMQLMMAFGVNPGSCDPKPNFALTTEEENFGKEMIPPKGALKIGIVLSGSDRAKFWGTENFKSIINSITDKFNEYRIYLFATQDYTEEINDLTSTTSAISAPAAGKVVQYAALLKQMNIILTPDTSAVHFASTFNIPVVVLYHFDQKSNAYTPWYPIGVPYAAFEHPVSISEIHPGAVFAGIETLINAGINK